MHLNNKDIFDLRPDTPRHMTIFNGSDTNSSFQYQTEKDKIKVTKELPFM